LEGAKAVLCFWHLGEIDLKGWVAAAVPTFLSS